jgi:hypothetical protein
VAPTLPNPHFNKAQALEQMGRATEAAAEYRAVLQQPGAESTELGRVAHDRLVAIEKPSGR